MVELYKEGIIAHIQIHDELDFSIESEEQADKIKDIMEQAVDLEVPNKVDYESGPNWGRNKIMTMAYLNANIPPIYCKIRKEYLYDLKKHQGESSDCCYLWSWSLFQVAHSYLTFMLPNGACFWRLPISAFFKKI